MWLVATVLESRFKKMKTVFMVLAALVLACFSCVSLSGLRGKTSLVQVFVMLPSPTFFSFPWFSKVVFSMERIHFGVWKNCNLFFFFQLSDWALWEYFMKCYFLNSKSFSEGSQTFGFAIELNWSVN